MTPHLETIARAVCLNGDLCVRVRLKAEHCLNSGDTCKANATQLALGGPEQAARAALSALLPPSEEMKAAMDATTTEDHWPVPDQWGVAFTAAINLILAEGEGKP